MKNSMQLKAKIKNISKEKNISAQIVLQNFMLERLLERISVSEYRQHFILKGGFLIASIVGIDTRATMDMDATIKGLPVTRETILDMFEDICRVQLDDNVTFKVNKLEEIRESDNYSGFRVSLSAILQRMEVVLKLDITSGDKITPKEIKYEYKLMLEDRYINILAYNIETVLAEKIETIITRGDQNTRPRDFYDIYILYKLQEKNIDYKLLKLALDATTQKRNSTEILVNHEKIISIIENSDVMHKRWNDYRKDFDYAKDVNFIESCNSLKDILKKSKFENL